MDCVGAVAEIKSMENNYELAMVGKNHDNLSPIRSGLAFWNEFRELGMIGDVLASADFMGNTTILVVQQQTECRKSQSCKGGRQLIALCRKESLRTEKTINRLNFHILYTVTAEKSAFWLLFLVAPMSQILKHKT